MSLIGIIEQNKECVVVPIGTTIDKTVGQYKPLSEALLALPGIVYTNQEMQAVAQCMTNLSFNPETSGYISAYIITRAVVEAVPQDARNEMWRLFEAVYLEYFQREPTNDLREAIMGYVERNGIIKTLQQIGAMEDAVGKIIKDVQALSELSDIRDPNSPFRIGMRYSFAERALSKLKEVVDSFELLPDDVFYRLQGG